MGTANFKSPKYFDLYAILDENTVEGQDDVNFLIDYEIDELIKILDDFNRQLYIFEVSLINGYYHSIQLYADFLSDDYEYFYNDKDTVTVEDIEYIGYDNVDEFIKDVEIEKASINMLFDKIAREYGFYKLSVAGRGSDGTVSYNIDKDF